MPPQVEARPVIRPAKCPNAMPHATIGDGASRARARASLMRYGSTFRSALTYFAARRKLLEDGVVETQDGLCPRR